MLDAQHSKLLEISSKAVDLFATSPVRAADFKRVLGELADVQRDHFAVEEETLARNGYPDLAAHVAEHDAYRLAFAELFCQAENGAFYMRALSALITAFVADHMLQTDMACKDYLKGR